MSDQPKPTGEWTARTVIDMIAKDSNAEWNVADAHNAVLAAVLKEYRDEVRAAHVMQKQLAAERELADIGRKWKTDSSLKTWFPFTAEEILQLREQLAGRHKLCVDFEMKWKAECEKSRVLGNMTDGFREQLAAEREKVEFRDKVIAQHKDALHRLQDQLAVERGVTPYKLS